MKEEWQWGKGQRQDDTCDENVALSCHAERYSDADLVVTARLWEGIRLCDEGVGVRRSDGRRARQWLSLETHDVAKRRCSCENLEGPRSID